MYVCKQIFINTLQPMKDKIVIILLTLFCSCSAGAIGNPILNVVPKPIKTTVLQGTFEFRKSMEIAYPAGNHELIQIARLFADRFHNAGGPSLEINGQADVFVLGAPGGNGNERLALLPVNAGHYVGAVGLYRTGGVPETDGGNFGQNPGGHRAARIAVTGQRLKLHLTLRCRPHQRFTAIGMISLRLVQKNGRARRRLQFHTHVWKLQNLPVGGCERQACDFWYDLLHEFHRR